MSHSRAMTSKTTVTEVTNARKCRLYVYFPNLKNRKQYFHNYYSIKSKLMLSICLQITPGKMCPTKLSHRFFVHCRWDFVQARCPSYHPNNSVKVPKGNQLSISTLMNTTYAFIQDRSMYMIQCHWYITQEK